MIKVKQLSKKYKLGKTDVYALSDINLEINDKEFTAITGPSGSGKTTLLNIIGCLDKPDSGSIYFDDQVVSDFTSSQQADFRLNTLGFVFQDFNLLPTLNVYENIELPYRLSNIKSNKQKILELIESVGLQNHIKHKPNELSGGQQQRVAVARALSMNPKVVLADEPTANLDSETGASIIELMQELNNQLNTTFIFSTHDPNIVALSQKVYSIKDGKLKN